MAYFGKYSTSGNVKDALISGELRKPYVAIVGDELDYDSQTITNDLLATPLTITILEDGKFTLNSGATVQYSKNGGNWISKSSFNKKTVQVKEGDKIAFKGTDGGKNLFSGSTLPFIAAGNIMSLIGDDDFSGATTLTATFESMFRDCHKLLSIDTLILPATTLVNSCYRYMFFNCSGLTSTSAPTLPAQTLTNMCYQGMFNNCTSIVHIECLATDISATNCTSDWVGRLSNSGTFVKAATMNDWTTGTSGIPEGWTVKDAE